MPARTLMVQGTASSVGKSLLVAALCRYFQQKGLKVAPFKSQNMSNNSFVTNEGLEIGRAQAMQAEACGIEPSVDMNPVLLKCESDHRLQVVALGKAGPSMEGNAYYDYSSQLKPVITGALNRLREKYDLVILEGAGSPAEVNLQSRDLANMFAAKEADAPVLLVGDIDRGGVFASLIGTLDLLSAEDRARVKGLIINKFRGNLEILKPGVTFIEDKSKLPVLGVLPYLSGLAIAEEDAVALDEPRENAVGAQLKVVVIKFPRISNFDDFQPLEREKAVNLKWIEKPSQAEGADLVILPGTKATVADLQWLRAQGFESLLRQRAEEGLPLLGICGGYQMLGQAIEDPDQVESTEKLISGLGLLPVVTRFEKEKITSQINGEVKGENFFMEGQAGSSFKSYEIHMGRVERSAGARALFQLQERNGQKVSETEGVLQGSVAGTLQHGLFENHSFRQGLLTALGKRKNLSLSSDDQSKEAEYDRLAQMVRDHLDTKFLDRLVLDQLAGL
ncbi:MAG TPA: cobyric acid synthase [bacterium]|jgi:adenosylcobyric acid synthase|nr:cobyric acid synthase [bacterium]